MRLNLRFFLGRQISRGDLTYLMPQQIELLFTGGLRRIKRCAFPFHRAQLPENFSEFLPRLTGISKRIK